MRIYMTIVRIVLALFLLYNIGASTGNVTSYEETVYDAVSDVTIAESADYSNEMILYNSQIIVESVVMVGLAIINEMMYLTYLLKRREKDEKKDLQSEQE